MEENYDISTIYQRPGTAARYNVDVKFYQLFLRTFEIVCASAALLLGLPIMLIFAVAIKIDTQGAIIYKQDRVGLHGKVFQVYKLRSMVPHLDNSSIWTEKNDFRVTRVGRIIRKTRIDELPQLFNILKGDMSFIGPRPERPELTLEFERRFPGFIKRLQVKPGLTGWAQVNGGYSLTPKEKLTFDLYYIENRSLKLDAMIYLKTAKVIFTGEGAW